MKVSQRGVVVAAGLASLLAACGPPMPLDPVLPSWRLEAMALDFGRVRAGTAVSRTLEVENTSQSDLELTLITTGPFTASPGSATLRASGRLEVTVTFQADPGSAEGNLQVDGARKTQRVDLSGVGVPARDCRASAPCRVSTWDLETDTCREAVAPDDSPCESTDLCLESTRCRAGVCVGEFRSCDDGNPCTTDGCNPMTGCRRDDKVCPPSSSPCRDTACNRDTGRCEERPRALGTPCGTTDCTTASVCDPFGACIVVSPAPEGALCRPEVACLPEGRCRQGRCQGPDAGVLGGRLAQRLRGVPSLEAPALLTASATPTALPAAMLVSCQVSPGDGGAPGCVLSSFTFGLIDRWIPGPAVDPDRKSVV